VIQTILATFENGLLKPDQSLMLPNHAKVRITVELLKSDLQLEWDAHKEERLAALEALFRMAKPHSEHLKRDELHERR
jgi:predicted DNA-binding antitoxin AbrB/MazE fold protein